MEKQVRCARGAVGENATGKTRQRHERRYEPSARRLGTCVPNFQIDIELAWSWSGAGEARMLCSAGFVWGDAAVKLLEFRTKKDIERAKVFEEANRSLFERECLAAGVDPTQGVSPSLLKLIDSDQADGPTTKHRWHRIDR